MMRERHKTNRCAISFRLSCGAFGTQAWTRAIPQRWCRQGDEDVVAEQLVKVFECGSFPLDISLWSPLNQPWTTETMEMPAGWLSIDRIKVKHSSVQCIWANAQADYVSSPAFLKSVCCVIFVIYDSANQCSHIQSANMTSNTCCVYSSLNTGL